VYAANERQYTKASEEDLIRWVVLTSDGRWNKKIDSRIGNENAALRELYRSVATQR